jgi:hypothetical protein
MRAPFAVAVTLLLLVSTMVRADQSWLCIDESVTGFAFKDQRWQQTNFEEGKYIVRPLVQGDTGFDPGGPVQRYGVFTFGEDTIAYTCYDGFNLLSSATYSDIPVLNCGGFGQFRFDRDTLRFLRTYVDGYTYIPEGGDNNDNTPLIAIGTCSKIN